MANYNPPANKRLGASHNPAFPEYRSWAGLRQRCMNPKNRKYSNYGGRGIKVCERWDDFEAFLADMGRLPGPGYSIDRIDNDGNYEPSNCRWATYKQQANNRRPKSSYRKRRRAQDGSLIENATMTSARFHELLDLLPGSRETIAAILHVSRTAVRRYTGGTSISHPVATRLEAAVCAAVGV